MNKLTQFWHRISDGLAVDELWGQLRREATSGYRLYKQDAMTKAPPARPARRPGGAPRQRHLGREFAWAILLHMSPARRVVLLLALVLQFTQYRLIGLLLIVGLLALEIADRVSLKRDLEIAREIQAWLLPATPPEVAGAEVAFVNQPANTVSGDFYDAFWRSPSVLMLALADVAGKGLPAALLTATFQASLHTLAAEGLTLEGVVAALNRYACGHSAGGTRFTTAVVAEYEPAARRLRYVNAGHNPPLLRRAGAEPLERLQAGGVPLGILAEAAYESGEVELHPGDALLLFTDGVTETFNPGSEEYGEERLQAVLLAAPAGAGAAAIRDAVVGDCTRFRGDAPRQDDVTCLVLRRHA
ncbi:MAG TPA: PP2C family protein-serine/threonine phosphatase [Terriglobales bacterium]|nr:PP2C family protein-serine/threonine phosphatase [Terriglobales bacterium]